MAIANGIHRIDRIIAVYSTKVRKTLLLHNTNFKSTLADLPASMIVNQCQQPNAPIESCQRGNMD